MGNALGAMFFCVCCIIAIMLWLINVSMIDNVFPTIQNSISTVVTNPDPYGQMQTGILFLLFDRLMPVVLIIIGLGVWYHEAVLSGRYDQGM